MTEKKTTKNTEPKWKGAKKLQPLLIPLDKLHEDPDNENPHTTEEIQRATIDLAEHGQQKNISVFRQDGKLVIKAGHKLLAAARVLGWTHLAGVEYEGTKARADAWRVADNKIGQDSKLDEKRVLDTFMKLSDEASDYFDPDFDVGWMGFDEVEMQELEARLKEAADENIDFPDDDEPSPSGSGEDPKSFDPVIAYNLVFDHTDQQNTWFGFLRALKDRYPEEDTVAARLIRWLKDIQKGGAGVTATPEGFQGGSAYSFRFGSPNEFTRFNRFLVGLKKRYEGGDKPRDDLLRLFAFLDETTE